MGIFDRLKKNFKIIILPSRTKFESKRNGCPEFNRGWLGWGWKMERKTLSKAKDEGKEESSIEKILEIEEAYFDLMKAYSSCLTSLKSKKIKYPPLKSKKTKSRFSREWHKEFSKKYMLHKDNYAPTYPKRISTELLLMGNILAPRFTKWSIKRKVDLLREAFLWLIVQNRNKIDSKIIKQFELYCEDMNKLSAQVAKSGLIALFYGSIPAALLWGILQIVPVSLIKDIAKFIARQIVRFSFSLMVISEFGVILSTFIIYLLFYVFFFFVLGFWGSRRVFSEATVPEKEKKNFVLIHEYLEFV